MLTAVFVTLYTGCADKEQFALLFMLFSGIFFFLAVTSLIVSATIRVAYRDKEIIVIDGKIKYLGKTLEVSKILVNKHKEEERKLGHFIHVNENVYFVEKVNKQDLFTHPTFTGKSELLEFSKDYDFYFGATSFVDFNFIGDIFR